MDVDLDQLIAELKHFADEKRESRKDDKEHNPAGYWHSKGVELGFRYSAWWLSQKKHVPL